MMLPLERAVERQHAKYVNSSYEKVKQYHISCLKKHEMVNSRILSNAKVEAELITDYAVTHPNNKELVKKAKKTGAMVSEIELERRLQIEVYRRMEGNSLLARAYEILCFS